MHNRTMKLLLLVLGVGFFGPVIYSQDDLVLVKTSILQIHDDISESASQDVLAEVVESARRKSGDIFIGKKFDDSRIWFETATVVRSGSSSVSKNVRTVRFPTEFGATQLLKSEKDRRSYSIAETSTIDHDETIVIPGEVESFMTKEVGTTVEVLPKILADGKIRLDGKISETVLVNLGETNPTPVISARKRDEAKNEIEIAKDPHPKLEFETAEKSISATFDTKQKHFTVLHIKGSVINRLPTPTGEEAKEEDLTLVAMTEVMLLPPPAADESKGGKVHFTIRFVESAEALGIPNHIMRDSESQLLIRSLAQRKDVDLLSAPSLVTESGEEGKIQVGREFIYPATYQAAEFSPSSESGIPVAPATPNEFVTTELGISMTLEPRILDDGQIEVQAKSKIPEFERFVDFGNPIIAMKMNPFAKPSAVGENRILATIFRTRSQETTVRVPDGATFVMTDLTDFVTREAVPEEPFSIPETIATGPKRRNVVALVTVRRMK